MSVGLLPCALVGRRVDTTLVATTTRLISHLVAVKVVEILSFGKAVGCSNRKCNGRQVQGRLADCCERNDQGERFCVYTVASLSLLEIRRARGNPFEWNIDVRGPHQQPRRNLINLPSGKRSEASGLVSTPRVL